MHPSLISQQIPNKEPSGSISSPSAASSGYGSSTEDDIGPYSFVPKPSTYDFSQDLETFHKKPLDEFDSLCLLSQQFLEEANESFEVTGHKTEPTLANEVFEFKTEERTDLMFNWQDDVTSQIFKLEKEVSSRIAATNAAASSPSSVDFFTEFFNDCSPCGESENSANYKTIENIDSQCQPSCTSSLSISNVYPSTRVDRDERMTSQGSSTGSNQIISMFSEFNEIDDMFNFVLDTDDNLLQITDNCVSRDKVVYPFESHQCNYDECTSELQHDIQKLKYDKSLGLSPVVGEEMALIDLNELRSKRKRLCTFEINNPSKSQKQEFLQNSETSPIPLSSTDFKLQSIFDSIPFNEDLKVLDNLNFTQDDNDMCVDSQITKDTFLSNFTFQINEPDNEETSYQNEISPDDVKALFNAPLDVGEIFSNLQFTDLQSDVASENFNKSSEFVSFSQAKASPTNQQPNCSYFIIAVPTSSNSLTSCILVKPNNVSKNVSIQNSFTIKTEPQIEQQRETRSAKTRQPPAIKQEIMETKINENRGNVLQTILTCGAINFNANQGSDAIYEGIIRGQLTSSDAKHQQNKTQQSIERHNQHSTAQTKSFKSDTGSVKGSNILQRLLKGQMHDRDILKRPMQSSSSR